MADEKKVNWSLIMIFNQACCQVHEVTMKGEEGKGLMMNDGSFMRHINEFITTFRYISH